MDDKSDKTKSVWSDISKVWGRIAGVIAAVGVSATFIVKVFNTSPELTYSLFAVGKVAFPTIFHQRRILSTAKAPVSQLVPRLT